MQFHVAYTCASGAQAYRAVSCKAAELVLDHGLQLGLCSNCNAISGLLYVGCHLAVHQAHMAVSTERHSKGSRLQTYSRHTARLAA